jgi:hypothetical protein
MEDAKKYGHDLKVVVAGDKKTPHETKEFCAKHGITYLSFEHQNLWLQKDFPDYNSFLPANCIQRRNVAILYAYVSGADKIYTIDDDNFLEDKDYIGQHNLGRKELKTLSSYGKWLNVCLFLQDKNNSLFYHRGYSFKNRGGEEDTVREHIITGETVVNAGLWLGDPDIDAVTRLSVNPEVVSIRSGGDRFAFAKGTKAPFNSQNTALDRKVIPAYCMLTGVGRYDDIIPSYFVKRIADHLGEYISFGPPIVRQERNKHDIFKDLSDELLGMQLIDDIVDWLYDIPLTALNYGGCLKEILPKFRDKYITNGKYTSDQIKFLKSINRNYEEWLRCMDLAERYEDKKFAL